MAKSSKGFVQNRFESVTFEEGNPFEEDKNKNKSKNYQNNDSYQVCFKFLFQWIWLDYIYFCSN